MKKILVGLVAIVAAFAAQATVYRAGFRQGRFWLNNSKTVPSFAQDAYTATSWDWTLSAFMCNVQGNAGASGVNPVSGKTWDWQNYYGYVYDGEMWMDARTTYTFGGNFDDGSAILVDGAVAWAQGDPGGTASGYNNWVAPRNYKPDTTGWHTVKLLVWDWEGGKNITCDALSATMWNTNRTTTAAPTSDWSKFQDDGSGSLFRARLADTYLGIGEARATADGFAVSVTNLAAQAVTIRLFAASADQGETDAGWTVGTSPASFAAGESKELSIAWPAGTIPVYRVHLSGTDSSLAPYGDFWEWSAPHVFGFVPGVSASITASTPVEATVSVSCGYAETLAGASPDIVVTAHWGAENGGSDPSAWANSREYSAQQPGSFTDTFTCAMGSSCYLAFSASIGGGDAVWSDVLWFGTSREDYVNPADFTYRAEVTFPGFAGGGSLANFPVLVRLAETEGGFSYAQAAADGSDIRFALDDGTPLASEIDVWDDHGESLVWVKIPLLASGTAVYLYWGSPAAEFPASQTNGAVWTDAAYVGVWHLGETGDSFADATANGLTGTRNGTEGRVADGSVGGGHRISTGASGSKENVGIDIPNYNSFGVGDSFTISGWLRYPQGQTPGYDRVFSRKSSYDGSGWEVTLRNGNQNNIDHRGGNGNSQETSAFTNIADAVWHHLLVTYDGTASSVFVDGVSKASGKNISDAASDNAKILVLGNNAAYNEVSFKGALDEVRLRDAVSDAAWAATEYATVADAAFASVGPAEEIDVNLPTLATPSDFVPDHHAVAFVWTLRDPGTSPATVVAEIGTESGVYTQTVTLAFDLSVGALDTATIDELLCNTTYFLRVSATNASGTISSMEKSFTTLGASSFSGESLAVSGADALTAEATLTAGNPDATVSVSLLLGPAGAAPTLRNTWTATTSPQTFTHQVSGLLFGDYEAHFEAEATCSVCSGVSTASSETVSATLAGECRWTGAAGDLSWNTPGNWSSGTVPGPLDTVVFPSGSLAADATIALDAPQTVSSVYDASGVSFTIGSADDVSASRILSIRDYIREGQDNVTLTIATPLLFVEPESGTNTLVLAAGTLRARGAVSAAEAGQYLLQSGPGTFALAAAGGNTQPHFLVTEGVLQPEANSALKGNATVGGGNAEARLNCTVNLALGNVGTITALTNGYALLRQTNWGYMPDSMVARDGGTVQVYDWSYGHIVRLTGGTIQGGSMNCGSYSGQGIYSYASTIPSFFRAGFSFNQYGGATLSVEDGEAIVDLTIAGNISWAGDSWNSLSKNGGGTLRMTGTSGGTSSQPFQLNAGTLLCDNASGTPIGNTLLNVKAGATLGGTGFVGGTERGNVVVAGTTTNPGVLAPGSVDEETGARIHGTFTVGSATQTNLVSMGAWTKLVAGIGSRNSETGLSDFDKLMVHGDLLIGDNCTLDLTTNSADLSEIKGGKYTIVEADSITGTFATVLKPKNSWKVTYVSEEVEGVMVVKKVNLDVPSKGLAVVVR